MPTSRTLSAIDRVELFRVLAGKTLDLVQAKIDDVPKFIEWTVFAKMIYKVVCRVLRPIDRRGYAFKIDTWVAYHITIRCPIILGHLWFYEFTQTLKQARIPIWNPRYLTCLLTIFGFDLSNYHHVSLQGVRKNESLINSLFNFANG